MPFALIALATCVVDNAALGQACDCDGHSPQALHGGDERPLTWLSAEVPAAVPKLVCYARSVENHGPQPVTDVNWDVAGYHKGVLPKGPLCDTTTVAEEPKNPDPKGLLYFGPGT
jgi:hypothetical protein